MQISQQKLANAYWQDINRRSARNRCEALKGWALYFKLRDKIGWKPAIEKANTYLEEIDKLYDNELEKDLNED